MPSFISRVMVLVLLALAVTPAQAQPATRLEDALLDELAGHWEITRKVRGTTVQNSLDAQWVLQHRFLQLHMIDVADPPKYEAIVLIGYDKKTERYVAHWTDIFGGGASAMGYGKRIDDSIAFVFAYPDGPFYNTFTWDRKTSRWTMLLEAEGKDGKRVFFAEDALRRK